MSDNKQYKTLSSEEEIASYNPEEEGPTYEDLLPPPFCTICGGCGFFSVVPKQRQRSPSHPPTTAQQKTVSIDDFLRMVDNEEE
jgi:hypothetical protein